MFVYGGVRAMFLGLKFHLKTTFLGSKICNMNFPFFGGKNFQQLSFFLDSIHAIPQKYTILQNKRRRWLGAGPPPIIFEP